MHHLALHLQLFSTTKSNQMLFILLCHVMSVHLQVIKCGPVLMELSTPLMLFSQDASVFYKLRSFWTSILSILGHPCVSTRACEWLANGFTNSALLDSDLYRIKVVSEDQGFQLKKDRQLKPGAFGSPALSVSGLQANCSSHEGCLSALTVLTDIYIF